MSQCNPSETDCPGQGEHPSKIQTKILPFNPYAYMYANLPGFSLMLMTHIAQDGFTPLAVALQEGRDAVVALLLEKDDQGRVKLPPLHIAAKKDDAQAAILLLRNENTAETTIKVCAV